MKINCHTVFIVKVRFLQKIFVIRKKKKKRKARLSWLNWESQKRTTWKISSRTPEKHNPPCMLSRIVPLSYQPFIWWPSVPLAHSYLIQGKQWKLKSLNSSDYNRYCCNWQQAFVIIRESWPTFAGKTRGGGNNDKSGLCQEKGEENKYNYGQAFFHLLLCLKLDQRGRAGRNSQKPPRISSSSASVHTNIQAYPAEACRPPMPVYKNKTKPRINHLKTCLHSWTDDFYIALGLFYTKTNCQEKCCKSRLLTLNRMIHMARLQ